MGLNLLLSTNHIVIHSYSPVADSVGGYVSSGIVTDPTDFH